MTITGFGMRRRILLGGILAVTAMPVRADETLIGRLQAGGLAILMRHAQTVSGTGDPPGFRLDDCATQRNLSEEGREDARAWGRFLRERSIPVGYVGTSAWCRCRDTATLIDIGPAERLPPLDSFFEDRAKGPRQTEELAAWVRGWKGPGNALLVTHMVNITALTDVSPRSGEAVVVEPADLSVLGRLPPPA